MTTSYQPVLDEDFDSCVGRDGDFTQALLQVNHQLGDFYHGGLAHVCEIGVHRQQALGFPHPLEQVAHPELPLLLAWYQGGGRVPDVQVSGTSALGDSLRPLVDYSSVSLGKLRQLTADPLTVRQLSDALRAQVFHHAAGVDEVIGETAGLAQLRPHELHEGVMLFPIEAGVTHPTHLESGQLEVLETLIDVLLYLRLESSVLSAFFSGHGLYDLYLHLPMSFHGLQDFENHGSRPPTRFCSLSTAHTGCENASTILPISIFGEWDENHGSRAECADCAPF